MPEHAPLVVLVFLASAAGFGGLAVTAGGALALRRRGIAKWAALGALAIAVTYAATLLGVASRSDEKVLRRGDRKYFCEIDCHLAYSVESAAGSRDRLTVALRTWFDPNMIARFRGDSPLTPSPRIAYIEDGSRHRVFPVRLDETPLSTPLRPGESYRTLLVFDLPARFRASRLFVGDPPGIENALLGRENGPTHGKVYFAID